MKGRDTRDLIVVWVLASMAQARCDSAGAPATFAVQDSAGVRIVSSSRPLLSEGPHWTVDSVSLVKLGGLSADSAHQFFRVQSVDLLPSGELVGVDGSSRELRLFTREGRHEWSFGGPGEGPGQFGQITYLGRAQDGSFWLWDRALARLTTVNPTGELVEVRRPASATTPIVFERTANGRYLAAYPTSIPPPHPGTVLTDTIAFWLLNDNLTPWRKIARLPGPLWMWTGHHQLPVPLTANPLRAVAGDAILTAAGPTPIVSVYDSLGALSAQYRLVRPLREVSPSEIRALVDSRLEEGVFPGTPAVWREWLDQMPLPNAQPAFDRMLVSSDGAIWLRRFELHLDRASTWEVLRADGVYLTDVRVPQGLELMAIESTTVAGVVHDSLDIEHIVVHRLNRDETANQ